MRTTALLLVLPALVLAGCTTPTQSQADQGVSTPPPVTTTTISRPPRPAEIPLDIVDPCKILTASQRNQLGLDNPPSGYVDAGFGDAKACTIRNNTSGNVARLALVTASGVDVWLSENAEVDAKLTMVAGYPALTVRTPGLDDVCNVEVDVAEGQFLNVMFRDGGNTTAMNQDLLCLGAQRVAEAAMATLLERH